MSVQIEIPHLELHDSDTNSITHQRKKKMDKKAMMRSLRMQIEDAWEKFQELEEGHHVDKKAFNRLIDCVEDLELKTSHKLERCSLIKEQSVSKNSNRSLSHEKINRKRSHSQQLNYCPVFTVTEGQNQNNLGQDIRNVKKNLFNDLKITGEPSKKKYQRPNTERIYKSAVFQTYSQPVKAKKGKIDHTQSMINFSVAVFVGIALILMIKLWSNDGI